MASYPATNLSLAGTITISHAPPVADPVPTLPPVIEADSVHLSQAAQVLQLSQQGQTTSQIGSNLGLTTAEVDADLGAVVATILSDPASSEAVAWYRQRRGKLVRGSS